MKELFVNLLNMSIAASWLILAVIVFRLIFKKAPRWIVGILWCLVGFRLICPISFSTPISIIRSDTFVVDSNSVTVDTGVDVMDTALNTYLMQSYNEPDGNVVSNSERIITSSTATVLQCIWVFGIIFLVAGSTVACVRLKMKLGDAVRLSNNIYETEKISSPFVMGIIRPRIYIPYYLEAEQLSCVVLHEQAHIRRKDHIIKPVAYFLLAVYWFNPLVWVAFILLCRDIELACDEKVIRTIGLDKKKLYSMTLLECSVPHRLLLSCPIAFAEVSVKERIVNIMKIKKTNKLLVAGALMAAIAVMVVFATNQANASENRILSTPIVTEYVEDVLVENAAEQSVLETGDSIVSAYEDRAENGSVNENGDLSENSSANGNTSENEEVLQKEDASQNSEASQDGNGSNNQETSQNAVTENGQPEGGAEQAGNGQSAGGTEQAGNGQPEGGAAQPDNSPSSGNAEIKLVRPVPESGYTSVPFSSEHPAVDYALPKGSPIVASITGTVTAAGFDNANGNYIVITGADGWSVYYNHCESVSVAVNDSVSAGALIATVGSTGNSTGPHLDFAVSDSNGRFYNPEVMY